VNSLDDFITLIQDELGLPVTAQDADRGLDQLSGWDSVYLITLLAVLERKTGRSIPLPAMLEASSLGDIYAVAVRK
jgi:acyl carrier protein